MQSQEGSMAALSPVFSQKSQLWYSDGPNFPAKVLTGLFLMNPTADKETRETSGFFNPQEVKNQTFAFILGHHPSLCTPLSFLCFLPMVSPALSALVKPSPLVPWPTLPSSGGWVPLAPSQPPE